MRSIIGLSIGAVVGGVLGYFHVLCPGGACPITGSWLGGAIIGGVVGLFLAGGCPMCAASCRADKQPGDDRSNHPG